jgi:xylulokinase
MGLFLGIDLGTSYFKAGLFDENGRLKGMGRQFVRKSIKNELTCELPVKTFWDTLFNCVQEAVCNAKVSIKEIRSVSYSSQANSFILLDGNNEPLTPLILWPDERAEGMDSQINLFAGNCDFMEKTGLGITPTPQFSVAKMIWFQNKQPQIWKHTRSIMSISDYLVYALTGQKVGDYSTATMTGLFDNNQGKWWNEALEIFNIESNRLSIPHRIGTYVSNLTPSGAQLIGLERNTLFYLGGLDHHIAAIGAGIPLNNDMSESTGTVLACVNYLETYSPTANCCVAPGLDKKHYFQMAFDNNGASSLEWYQNEYAPEFSISELLKMADNIEIGCEGLIAKPCAHKFLGFNGFEQVKQTHHHGHFVRAILESTALSLTKMAFSLPGNAETTGIVSVGGGARSKLWVEIKSNLIGKRFFVPECSESACLGAAMVAATGIIEEGDIYEVIQKWARYKELVSPKMVSRKKYLAWYQSVEKDFSKI